MLVIYILLQYMEMTNYIYHKKWLNLIVRSFFCALKWKKTDFNKKRQDFTKKFSKKWQKHTDKLQLGVLNIIEGHKNFFRYFYFVVLSFPRKYNGFGKFGAIRFYYISEGGFLTRQDWKILYFSNKAKMGVLVLYAEVRSLYYI